MTIKTGLKMQVMEAQAVVESTIRPFNCKTTAWQKREKRDAENRRSRISIHLYGKERGPSIEINGRKMCEHVGN